MTFKTLVNRNSNQRSKLNISVNRLDYLGIIISNNVLKFFVKSFHNWFRFVKITIPNDVLKFFVKWIQFELMSPNTIPDNVLKIFVKSIKFVSMSQNMYNSERCSESFVKANKFSLIISNNVLKSFVTLNKTMP